MSRLKIRMKHWIPFVLLAIALAVFPFVGSTAAVNIGVYALIYGIAAIGLSLLMGLAGQVSLGHAAFFGTGGYAVAILAKSGVAAAWVAMPVAVGAAALAALLQERDRLAGKRVGLVLSGGNIDRPVYRRVLGDA